MSKIANNLIHKGYLKTDLLIEAFSEIDRSEFVPKHFRVAAATDIPLSIGHGQVLPEPSVTAFMLELLRPLRGHDVLVVGFGGGWVIAMLAYIVGSEGHVSAIDTLHDLKEESENNIKKYNFINRDNSVLLNVVEDCKNLRTNKFERIIVINPGLWSLCDFRDILDLDGVMVAPIDNIIHYFHNRKDEEEMLEERFDSIRFLPI